MTTSTAGMSFNSPRATDRACGYEVEQAYSCVMGFPEEYYNVEGPSLKATH